MTEETNPVESPTLGMAEVEALPAPEIKEHRSKILKPATINLVYAAPKNPTVRSMITADCRLIVPDELIDPESILSWLEHNFTTKKIPKNLSDMGVEFEFTRNEYGSCSYSSVGTAVVSINLEGDEVGELLDKVDSFEEFITSLSDRSDELASEEDVEYETDGVSYQYNNYSEDDHDGTQASINRSKLRRDAARWLHANNPELAREWSVGAVR